jgi:hypothetical protein
MGSPEPDEVRRRFALVLGFSPNIEVEVVEEFERNAGGKYERFRWVGD